MVPAQETSMIFDSTHLGGGFSDLELESLLQPFDPTLNSDDVFTDWDLESLLTVV